MTEAMELCYTSAPRGVRPGMSGFCTVAHTRGMSDGLRQRLERLSAYSFERRGVQPINFAYTRLTVGGQRWCVLSRVCAAGSDHTGRSNLFAHHVALSLAAAPDGGPAWLMRQPGVLLDAWSGEPRLLEPRRLPGGAPAPAPCAAWQAATGDAGWAGALVDWTESHVDGASYLVHDDDAQLLVLIDEALRLHPPAARWLTTFATHPHVDHRGEYRWRGCRAAPAARPGAFVLDTRRPAGAVPDGPRVAQARTGQAPARPTRAPVRPAPPVPAAPAPLALAPVVEPPRTPLALDLLPDEAPTRPKPPLTGLGPPPSTEPAWGLLVVGGVVLVGLMIGVVWRLGGSAGDVSVPEVREQTKAPPPPPPPVDPGREAKRKREAEQREAKRKQEEAKQHEAKRKQQEAKQRELEAKQAREQAQNELRGIEAELTKLERRPLIVHPEIAQLGAGLALLEDRVGKKGANALRRHARLADPPLRRAVSGSAADVEEIVAVYPGTAMLVGSVKLGAARQVTPLAWTWTCDPGLGSYALRVELVKGRLEMTWDRAPAAFVSQAMTAVTANLRLFCQSRTRRIWFGVRADSQVQAVSGDGASVPIQGPPLLGALGLSWSSTTAGWHAAEGAGRFGKGPVKVELGTVQAEGLIGSVKVRRLDRQRLSRGELKSLGIKLAADIKRRREDLAAKKARWGSLRNKLPAAARGERLEDLWERRKHALIDLRESQNPNRDLARKLLVQGKNGGRWNLLIDFNIEKLDPQKDGVLGALGQRLATEVTEPGAELARRDQIVDGATFELRDRYGFTLLTLTLRKGK